jgi:hypothetical protein
VPVSVPKQPRLYNAGMSETHAEWRGQDEAWLLACLHRDPAAIDRVPWPGLDAARWDARLALAASLRVRPLLHRRLNALRGARPIPDHVLASLDQATRAVAMRNLRSQAETAAVARASKRWCSRGCTSRSASTTRWSCAK